MTTVNAKTEAQLVDLLFLRQRRNEMEANHPKLAELLNQIEVLESKLNSSLGPIGGYLDAVRVKYGAALWDGRCLTVNCNFDWWNVLTSRING